ncbi:hypothetical protein FE236_13475 [Mariprofundus erugo]|uniref:tyrosine-type recombinase/integrase n=1 Tax=Mariprofundus erugo TaxID=2528639 RepID=UPI0010FED697|nr:hypothetical protein FE236_13475 [Mariprofundus erugo]
MQKRTGQKHRQTSLNHPVHSHKYYIESFGSDLNNPVDEVKKPEAHAGKRERVLTAEEEELLLDVLSTKHYHVYLAAQIALNTGMRRGEICALHFDNINLEERYIHVPAGATKNSKARYIGINDKLYNFLFERMEFRLTKHQQVLPHCDIKLVEASKDVISRTFNEGVRIFV